MAISINYGCSQLVFGIPAPDRIEFFRTCPISNLPFDAIKVRRRFRSREVACAFVKCIGRVEQWTLEYDGDWKTCQSLKLGTMKGCNVF